MNSLAGIDPWIEQALLLNSNQLQEKWTRGEDAIKPSQEEVDWWIDTAAVWYSFKNQWADSSG